MNLLEFAFVFSICAIFYAFALPSQNQNLLIAQKSLHHHLQHAQILALLLKIIQQSTKGVFSLNPKTHYGSFNFT